MKGATHALSLLQGKIYPCGWVNSLGWDTSQCLSEAWAEHSWLLHPSTSTECFIVRANKHIVTLSCSLCWWTGLCLTHSHGSFFVLQVLLLRILQDFFLPSCENQVPLSLETTKTFLVCPHIHTWIWLHYWHEEWKTGDGKIFTFSFADSETGEEQAAAADSTTI